MSTKTTFKRVALLAVAALTLGGLSAVSASATTGVNDGNVYLWCSTVADGTAKLQNIAGNSSCNGIAGPANSVVVSLDSSAHDADALTGDNAAITAAASFVTVSGSGAYISAASTAVAGSGTNPTTATLATASTGTLTIATPTSGTITVSYYKSTAAGVYSSTAAETLTINVLAAGVSDVFASAVVYGYTGDTTTAASIDATSDAALLATPVTGLATDTAKVVSFKVHQSDANAGALTSASTKAVVATASIGNLYSGNTLAGSYAAVAAKSANDQIFRLVGDGRSGVSTVTISVNGVQTAQYTVTFYSTTIAKLVVSDYKTLVAAGTGSHAATAATTDTTSPNTGFYPKGAFKIVANDATGNAITGGTLGVTITSSNPSVATAAAPTYSSTLKAWTSVVSYVGSGSATFTVKDTATGLISGTATVSTGKNVISSLILTTDAASYVPGDLVTLTATAKGSDGKPVADGYYYGVFTAKAVSSQALQAYPWNAPTVAPTTAGTLSVGDLSFTNGVATATFYAPAATTVMTLTTGSGVNIDPLLADTDISVTTTVTAANDASVQAATDAAQEATDAANAAYDAANNAMDSADAATAAAQDAADNASAALAAVTSLSATVAKLVKSVAAIAAALAKVQKKIGA